MCARINRPYYFYSQGKKSVAINSVQNTAKTKLTKCTAGYESVRECLRVCVCRVGGDGIGYPKQDKCWYLLFQCLFNVPSTIYPHRIRNIFSASALIFSFSAFFCSLLFQSGVWWLNAICACLVWVCICVNGFGNVNGQNATIYSLYCRMSVSMHTCGTHSWVWNIRVKIYIHRT